MEVRILRRREIERLTQLSKASIYRKMRRGRSGCRRNLASEQSLGVPTKSTSGSRVVPGSWTGASAVIGGFPLLPPIEGRRRSTTGQIGEVWRVAIWSGSRRFGRAFSTSILPQFMATIPRAFIAMLLRL